MMRKNLYLTLLFLTAPQVLWIFLERILDIVIILTGMKKMLKHLVQTGKKWEIP